MELLYKKRQMCKNTVIMAIMDHEYWMKLALEEAHLAGQKGEVPIGAVIVNSQGLVARTHNLRESQRSSVAHAELLAIQQANESLKKWRLEDCTLYVTLEPCLMCSGAIILARFATVVYGCRDPKAGAVDSLFATLSDKRLNHRPEVIEGVLAEEATKLLKDFFRQLREKIT